MAGIRICSNCKRSISDKELRSGSVTQQGARCVCTECSQKHGLRNGSRNEDTFILQSILYDVKEISRALTYEKSTWLNIAGAVTQCLVFGTLIFACMSSKESTLSVLILSLIFQVMTLTFFVVKK